MKAMYPCLWFDQNAEEAAQFYCSVFPNSRILNVSYYGDNMPLPAGTVLTVDFELNGRQLMALNGGPAFKFSEAVSLLIPCETQAEIDELWTKLTADGGQESQCGWLKDKFGFSWQIAPAIVEDLLAKGDQVKINAMLQAMMPMKKLDIAQLLAAYEAG